MRRRGFLVVWLLLLVTATPLVAGCARPEERPVKATIMRYNQLLSDCYQKLNMDPMQEVATAEHAERLYYHMAALGEGQARMKSSLKQISFETVDFASPEQCSVQTREVWDFSHQDLQTGKTLLAKESFVYRLRYELKREQDHWLVAKATAQEDEGR